MKNKTEIIIWIKRVIGFVAIAFWISVVYEIAQMPESFMAQAPYCMGVTMLTFGLLTAVYKALDYWESKGDS